jgi:hypothetical protein
MMNNSSNPNKKEYLHSAIILFVIFLVIIGLQYSPPTIDSFVNGGEDVFLYNILEFILILIFPVFLIGLGCIYLSFFHQKSDFPKRSNYWLITFFIGAGLLTIIGFVMGLLHLLFSWITIPIFSLVFFLFLASPKSKELADDFKDWISAKQFIDREHVLALSIRIFSLIVITWIILSKGTLTELFKDGGLHQYFGYFAEIRLNHSTWMDPNHPIIYDYLMGRGQGVYLFITSFTNEYTIQLVGVMYIISIGVLSRQLTGLLLYQTNPNQVDKKRTFIHILPDIVMILVITSPILQMETARFHLQTGAFFIFLAWISPMYLLKENRDFLFYSQIPILIAFPITGGIFLGLVGFIYGLSFITFLLLKKRDLLRYSIKSILVAVISSIFSFSLNWFYVGIPEIQPYQVFEPLILIDRLQHWSSPELLYYMNSAMSISVTAPHFSGIEVLNSILTLFSYPVSTIMKILSVNGFVKDLLFFSTILLIILILLINRNRMKHQNRIQKTNRILMYYWITFEASYLLKIILNSSIKQSSIDRMLIYFDVYPIITFFSIIIILYSMLLSGEQSIEEVDRFNKKNI